MQLAGWTRPDFTDDIGLSGGMGVLFTFNTEDAEMYIGRSPITVDMATALYMLRQKESMPHGRSWGDSFPGSK